MATHRPGPPARAVPTDVLPLTLQPELAALATRPPPGDWLYEIKFDGYRMLVRVDGDGSVKLVTRNGHDWTEKLTHLRNEFKRLAVPPGWYDGEIVVLGSDGLPDFNALQNAFDRFGASQIRIYLFDAPFLDGFDMRRVPVEERRAALKGVLRASHFIHFSEEFNAPGRDLVASACKLGLEGIIGKRRGSPYVSSRSGDWIKLKCTTRQEFVIGGVTPRDAMRSGIGALLVGFFDQDNVFRYAGKVGTGFSSDALAEMRGRLAPLAQRDRPFATATGHDKHAAWVRPEVVCEVAFAEWPAGRSLRHPAFKGLRGDRIAAVVRRLPDAPDDVLPEIVEVAAKKRTPAKARTSHPIPIHVTHSSRVIDQTTGCTKGDLVRYYWEVAPFTLPHLRGRPLYIVRAPEGVGGPVVFQQHPEGFGLKGTADGIWPGHDPAIAIDSAEDLAAAAQLGMYECHSWNSTATDILRPDRVIFDLDPGENVPWSDVQMSVRLVHAALDELGLRSWLTTTGGKGLHVVVPLTPEYDYACVKGFSRALAEHLAKVVPQRFVAKPGARNRVGKIFVDYLRNGPSQSTAAAFSARARPGLGVSMPIGWGDLAGTTGVPTWTVANAIQHLSTRDADPWANYFECQQRLGPAMERLGLSPPPSAGARG